MKFSSKIFLSVVVASVLSAGVSIFISIQRIHSVGAEQLVEKSRAILSRLEVVRTYVAQQGGLQGAVDHAITKYPDGNLPSDVRLAVLKQVPIFASMKVGQEGAAKEHYQFRVFSDEPRNSDNKATTSELEILKRFGADAKLPEIVSETEDAIVVYRPVYLSEAQGCMTCHGDPSTSPWKNGKDILGHKMENWKDGKLHGVFAITSSKAAVNTAASEASINIVMWAGGLAAVILLVVYLFLRGPLANLTLVIQELRGSGERVSSASSEISSSSQSLSASATQAAASIETTSASAEEVSGMIEINAKNADQAMVLSQAAKDQAVRGKAEVGALIESMGEIAEGSKKIEEIISVIDDIAFQTNLLALNASVEAARAGEQGKGFAVVAEAVRSLALRSAGSAKEINDLIKESVEKISRGYAVAESSGKVLEEIVQSVAKVNQLNTEVSTASKEQSAGVVAINRSIIDLDKVTQANAAVAEESAAAAEQLSHQSQKLADLVDALNDFIGGNDNNGSGGRKAA